MKLKYFGTAAAEGIPGLFCNCRVCKNALAKRGKEIKTRSQAAIDDKILIDFPPDTYMHVLNYGLDLRKIYHCIITHSHFDHLFERDFWCRLPLIANDIEEEPLNVYLTESGYKITEESLGKDFNSPRLKFHKIKEFEPFYIEDYKITPLKANHDSKADPVIYAIEHGGKAILYANDTGFLFDESLEYIKNLGIKFDFLSLDCTSMLIEKTRNGHMSLDVNVELHKKLMQIGACDEKTVVYVNHFSHNGLATHEEFVEIAGKYGYGVSYDGLEVEI